MGSSSKEDTARLFSEGERVLAYYGPSLYGAKVQKVERCEKKWGYLVHYLGWNKNWDEWVSEDRLLKHTEENLQRKKVLDEKEGTRKRTRSGRSAQKKSRSCEDTKADKEDDTKINAAEVKKRKNESSNEINNVSIEKLMKIEIPATLKKKLIEDMENIAQKDKLVKLPRSPNVDEILSEYLDFKTKKDGMINDSVAEILKGIRSYFDKALPMMLLYEKERQQYKETIVDDISPSTVYGAEHLLRLFVKFPKLFSSVNMEEETWNSIQQTLTDFIKFMQKNQSKFLVPSAYDCAEVSVVKGKEKEQQ